MSSPPECYLFECLLPPVFKCSCASNAYSCQKHCFLHIQGLCGGKLEPYIYIESSKSSLLKPKQTKSSQKLDPLPMSGLMTTLFPGEAVVFQCSMCGKLVPNSCSHSHACEKNEISVLKISFQRVTYNRYQCSICLETVHTAFLYSHADLHNNLTIQITTKEELQKISTLIIENYLKVPGKKTTEKSQDNVSEVSKNIINSLAKKDLPCLDSPLMTLPKKRENSGITLLDSD